MNELIKVTKEGFDLDDYAAWSLGELFVQEQVVKKKMAEIKNKLLDEMTKHDVISLNHEVAYTDPEDGKEKSYMLSIQKVDSYDRETLDSKLLRKDHPDIYDEYVKISPVKASVRISIKG